MNAILYTSNTGSPAQYAKLLADKTGLQVPASIAALPTLPVRHNTVCAPEDMLKTLMAKLEK